MQLSVCQEVHRHASASLLKLAVLFLSAFAPSLSAGVSAACRQVDAAALPVLQRECSALRVSHCLTGVFAARNREVGMLCMAWCTSAREVAPSAQQPQDGSSAGLTRSTPSAFAFSFVLGPPAQCSRMLLQSSELKSRLYTYCR